MVASQSPSQGFNFSQIHVSMAFQPVEQIPMAPSLSSCAGLFQDLSQARLSGEATSTTTKQHQDQPIKHEYLDFGSDHEHSCRNASYGFFNIPLGRPDVFPDSREVLRSAHPWNFCTLDETIADGYSTSSSQFSQDSLSQSQVPLNDALLGISNVSVLTSLDNDVSMLSDMTTTPSDSTSSDRADSTDVDMGQLSSRPVRLETEQPNVDPCYAQLLWTCLLDAPGHQRPLRDIYAWIAQHSPKASDLSSRGWMNSVRHNLSMNAAFQKVIPANSHTRKRGSLWRLSSDAVINGVCSTTRYRKTTKRRALRPSNPDPQRASSGARGGAASRRTDFRPNQPDPIVNAWTPPPPLPSSSSSFSAVMSQTGYEQAISTPNTIRSAAGAAAFRSRSQASITSNPHQYATTIQSYIPASVYDNTRAAAAAARYIKTEAQTAASVEPYTCFAPPFPYAAASTTVAGEDASGSFRTAPFHVHSIRPYASPQ